jgi:hypothetical protein
MTDKFQWILDSNATLKPVCDEWRCYWRDGRGETLSAYAATPEQAVALAMQEAWNLSEEVRRKREDDGQ